MIIKEGSRLQIFDSNDGCSPLIDEIICDQDIEIEGNGQGYAILLRREGCDKNNIFESEVIEKTGESTYAICGYFKDALLVVQSKHYNPAIFQSYMDY